MNYKSQILVTILLCLLSSSQGLQGAPQGYGLGKRPFLMVQVCLGSEKNLPVFIGVMRSIARSESMKFIDNSAQTQKDLESIGENIPHAKPTGQIVNIGVERGDGVGLGAGNLGLPKNQVAIGFSEGANSRDARKFADAVVHRLGERWSVEVVPPNEGARGMKTCSEQPEDTSK